MQAHGPGDGAQSQAPRGADAGAAGRAGEPHQAARAGDGPDSEGAGRRNPEAQVGAVRAPGRQQRRSKDRTHHRGP